MVTSGETPRRQWHGSRCLVIRDKSGTLWRVPEEKSKKNGDSPEIDVWWDRTQHGEYLVLRQDHPRVGHVGLFVLPQGQIYDLIDALNKALEGN
jgi:hypothetical protein